ncbi:MAG: formyltransferase family protein [Pseudomonadota bacterium]
MIDNVAGAQNVRFGVLLSAGGSAFIEAFEMVGGGASRFFVVTDRDCGAVAKAKAAGIDVEIIEDADRVSFSRRTAAALRNAGCRCAIMHFSRLVSADLFETILTVNVHPALLPAFPGLDGVGDAFKARSVFQGATLHVADAGMDTGPVLAQAVHPVPAGADLVWRHKLGFVQKAVVTALFFDWVRSGRVDCDTRGADAFDLDGLPVDAALNPGFATNAIAKAADVLLNTVPPVGAQQ